MTRILTYSDLELPRANIERIIRTTMAKNPATSPLTEGPTSASSATTPSSAAVSLSKDAKLAITKAATLFISYLTSIGIDVANANKQKMLTHEHVYTALVEAGFGTEWVEEVSRRVKEAVLAKKESTSIKGKRSQPHDMDTGETGLLASDANHPEGLAGEEDEETQYGGQLSGEDDDEEDDDEEEDDDDSLTVASSEQEILQDTLGSFNTDQQSADEVEERTTTTTRMTTILLFRACSCCQPIANTLWDFCVYAVQWWVRVRGFPSVFVSRYPKQQQLQHY